MAAGSIAGSMFTNQVQLQRNGTAWTGDLVAGGCCHLNAFFTAQIKSHCAFHADQGRHAEVYGANKNGGEEVWAIVNLKFR